MSLSQIYTAVVSGVAGTAVQDLLSVLTPSTYSAEILNVVVSQQTEEGDAAAEMLGLTLRTFTGHTAGSGGAAVTPVNRSPNGLASSCTARRNDTTQATGGTSYIHWSEAFNVQGRFVWPPPIATNNPNAHYTIIVPPSYLFVVSLDEAPADSVTFRVTVTWQEHKNTP